MVITCYSRTTSRGFWSGVAPTKCSRSLCREDGQLLREAGFCCDVGYVVGCWLCWACHHVLQVERCGMQAKLHVQGGLRCRCRRPSGVIRQRQGLAEGRRQMAGSGGYECTLCVLLALLLHHGWWGGLAGTQQTAPESSTHYSTAIAACSYCVYLHVYVDGLGVACCGCGPTCSPP
jgi:hypothetical protein